MTTKAQRDFLIELTEEAAGLVCGARDRVASALFEAGMVARRSYSVGSVKPRWLYTITDAASTIRKIARTHNVSPTIVRKRIAINART